MEERPNEHDSENYEDYAFECDRYIDKLEQENKALEVAARGEIIACELGVAKALENEVSKYELGYKVGVLKALEQIEKSLPSDEEIANKFPRKAGVAIDNNLFRREGIRFYAGKTQEVINELRCNE